MADRGSSEDRRGAPALRAFVPRGSLQWLAEHPELDHRCVDASLVFVDISGFTAMSERLARLGRVGAEEVTDLLNQTFSRLLAVAYEDDGSLLKFGGDALLLLFEGDDHAGRAVNAAWGMRRRLRELQPLRSSAGQVRLRMSVGVHTGAVDQFLVGSSHRELLIVGPAASEVVRMEGAAGPNQIMVSAAVVAALGDRIGTTPEGPGALLRRPPEDARIPAPTPVGDLDGNLARRLLPSMVRERLDDGVPGAEHRPSVIAFVKFTGVERHLAERGAAATADALGHLVDGVVEACAEHGVCLLSTDVDADGGKFILTAGVPVAQEFDGERVLRAARRILAGERRFPVKVGVHHGPVFAGVIGPWFRLTYTIIGDAVNLAARVMGHADPGALLATPEVVNRSQALFDLDELPPFPVKGKKQPVTAMRVGEPTSTRLRRARARFRLAGRQEELGRLVGLADAVEQGAGQLAQLVGPAGIGKSRLVDEVHERRPQSSLLMAGCSQHESATPYHAIAGLLRELLGLGGGAGADELAAAVAERAPALQESLPLLGDVLGIDVPDTARTADLTATFRAERTAAAAIDVLEATVPDPAILVFEDLHWVDPETRAVLLALTRDALPRRRWLLLLTSRHRVVLTTKDHPDEEVVELRPLEETDARDLVFAAAEEGLVTLERGQQLLARAGGNPFFLQELLRCDRDQGEDELPDTVDDLVQTQLDLLSPADRDLLAHAAVLGADIDPDLLEATADISVEVQRRAFSQLGGFVEKTPAGGFRFRHALMQDGSYQRLPFKRRRELHLAAAAAIERRHGTTRPDLLALHTYQARDWHRARAYALEAGSQAAARFANHTAAAHFRHAIESSRQLRDLPATQVAEDWERLGDMLLLGSSYDEAAVAYRSARRLAPPSRGVHLCGQIGQVRERQSRFSDALRWYTRALALDAEHHTGEAGRMLVEAAIVRARQGKPAQALQLAARAAAATQEASTLARVAYVRAWAAMLRGEDGRIEEERALRLFEAADDVIGLGLAYNIISMAAYYRGDWADAASAYEQAATLRRRVGDEVAAAVAFGNLGELLADQGHFERARALLEESRVVCAAAGYLNGRLFATMTLGRLDARCGDYEGAELRLKEALAGLSAIGMNWLVHECNRFLVELALFRGDSRLVIDRARALEEDARLGSAGLRSAALRLRICAHVVRGETAAAVAAAQALTALLDPTAHDYETGLSLAAAATVLEPAGGPLRERSRAILEALAVVADPEQLLFGPTSSRSLERDDEPVAATA